MTWARLDDGITDNPRLLALPRGVRLVHIEGIVWSCRHETDGRIPRHVLRKVTDEPDPEDAATTLVDAGLWKVVDDGWEIVGFLEDQRSSEDIAKTRAAALERQRRHRQHIGGDHSLCNPRYCKGASRVTDGVTNGGSHGPPTRPDPTRPEGEGKGGKTATPGAADAGGAGGPSEDEPHASTPAVPVDPKTRRSDLPANLREELERREKRAAS